MTLRFATRTPAASPMVRRFACRAHGSAANDNGLGQGADDLMLHAALRHFGEHGLGAARAARSQAEQAFFANDREGYAWWLGICRTLDRRLAAQLEDRAKAAFEENPQATG